MTQLSLDFSPPVLVGMHALPLLTEETVKRMRSRFMTKNFLISGTSIKDHRTWTGKGQMPAWVREMLDAGYTRQQLEASLP